MTSAALHFTSAGLVAAAMLAWGYNKVPDFFAQRIDVDQEPVYHVEETAEKRARTVKHLIQANHTTYSVIYHHNEFHNHTPHVSGLNGSWGCLLICEQILGSAYILGSTNDHLIDIYEEETKSLEKWTDSPGEITESNWRDFFGKKE